MAIFILIALATLISLPSGLMMLRFVREAVTNRKPGVGPYDAPLGHPFMHLFVPGNLNEVGRVARRKYFYALLGYVLPFTLIFLGVVMRHFKLF